MQHKQTVHIVDDDREILQSFSQLLEDEGLTVQTYDCARDFLDSLSHGEGGCVVVDVVMPDMTGVEMISAMRELGFSLPSIVVTAYADVPLVVKAMKLGATDFLEKPVEADALLRSVRAALAMDSETAARAAQKQVLYKKFARLSARERDVMSGLVMGKLNKTIAYELGISTRTVEKHRADIMMKTRSRSLSELVQSYLSTEIDDAPPSDATGLSTPRTFDAALAEEWRNAVQSGAPISMLLIDIAELAPFDGHSPSHSEAIMTTVAEVVFGAAENENGFITHYDGDAFAVALPATNHDGAKRLAEELRSAIEMSGFVDAHNRAGRRFAASIGMATIAPTADDRVEKIVCYADIALHRAKTAGRSGVYAFHDDPSCSKAKQSPTGGVPIPVIESSHCAECRKDAPRA